MSRIVVNLARPGFVNSRPVVRLAVLLWLLGLALVAANIWLYRNYFEGNNEKARRMTELEASVTAERQAIARLEGRLAGLDLARQNETVNFLNRKIADRTFAWSRLFDRLALILPGDVRLLSLSPDNKAQPARGSREQPVAVSEYRARVPLQLLAEARTDAALLELVDALFEDPAFRNPNPLRENRTDGQALRFALSVTYLPTVAEELATRPEQEGAAEEDGESTAPAGEPAEGPTGDEEEEP